MNDAEYVALMGTPPPAPVQPEPPTSAAFRLAARGPTDAVDSMTMAFQALDSAARPTGVWSTINDHATVSGFDCTIEPPRRPVAQADLELEALLVEEERIERATRTSRGLFGR